MARPKVNCSRGCWKQWAKDNILLILTLAAVLLGFVLVLIIRPHNPSSDVVMWIGLPGELFMRGLYCMVIPVLTSSVVKATASVDPKTNGKMSAISFVYMVVMVICGVIVGLVLSVTIKPGRIDTGEGNPDFTAAYYETQDVVADLLRNLVPNNVVLACIKTIYTSYDFDVKNVDSSIVVNTTTSTNITSTSSYNIDSTTETPKVVVETIKSLEYGDGTNLLGLLAFSAVFGIAIGALGDEGVPMYRFMSSLKAVTVKMLSVYLWALPIGTISLILKSMLRVNDLIGVWTSLGLFSATVIVGLLLHWFVTISLTYFLVTRKNPFVYQARCMRAILMSTITKTNAAIMPEIFYCVEVKNGIHEKISNYVIPLNVGMKSDGSAVFIISGAIYLAQSIGMSLNVGHTITMAIVAMVMGLSLPAVPSASLVAIVTVCNAVAVPTQNIGLLVSMEWLLDALRTAVNCVSHCSAPALVEAKLGKELREEKGRDREGINTSVPEENHNKKEEGESFL